MPDISIYYPSSYSARTSPKARLRGAHSRLSRFRSLDRPPYLAHSRSRASPLALVRLGGYVSTARGEGAYHQVPDSILQRFSHLQGDGPS